MGQSGYSLTCGVNGAGNLNASTTYQWTKNNGTQTQIQIGANPKVLSFSPLRLSDAGQYTCQATVSSPYLSDSINMMASRSVTVLSELLLTVNRLGIVSVQRGYETTSVPELLKPQVILLFF